ncbi:phage tail tape measure protein [Mycolicibacterium komossense]|uniref:Phage tail tape measure protein n=1 Tax=Mycolicibacterium komossense TaxID=1779 RepID=A0ABT3CM86_9MYCO|nr:phage tail tape measure protein [Mycolicibacterium komossense]MCV7230663.1 phage tail tape measure protein [Mycolicibacterium komossense]
MPIIPSFEGGIGKIGRDLDKAFDGVSKSASKAIAGGVKDGVADAERAVKASTDKIVALKEKEADAAGKVRVAEERLNEVRDKGATGSTLARAEEAREKALRGQAAALRNVEAETRSLERAQNSLADAQKKAESAGKDGGLSWLDKVRGKAGDAGDALEGLSSKASGVAGRIGSAGGEAGASFMEGFGGPLEALGTKAGPIGMGIAAAATIALAGGVLIAKQVFAGMDQQQAQANVQAKLGVDDATMKRIAGAAAQSYTKNFGESIEGNMEAARAAIQSGLLNPEASSGAQSQMISQLETVSSLLGEDIPAVARAANQAIATGLAPNATAAFDLITKGQQAGLNESEDWLDTINEYGTQFRKLGLSGPEAIGLISQAMKAGARDSDVAADALKEFSIRAIDGSKTTVDGFESLGLAADQMREKIAAGGPAAHDALGQVLDGLRNIKDPAEQSRIAVELFGTQSEDLGAALSKFDLSTAVGQLGDVAGATQKAADVAGGTASSSWESMERTVETAVDGMQQQLAGVLGPAVGDLAKSFTENEADVIGFFTTVGEASVLFVQVVTGAISGTIRGVALLTNAIGDAYGGITKFGASVYDLLGDHDTAEQWRKEAEAGFGLADGLYRMADAGDDLVKKLDHSRDSIAEQGAAAQKAATLNHALGDAVASIPNGKDIVLTDNSPETIERLKAIGVQVEQTPTGLALTATTGEAEEILNAFRKTQGAQPVEPPVKPDLTQANADMQAFYNQWQSKLLTPAAPGPANTPALNPLLAPYPRAAGGIDRLPGSAKIQPEQRYLVQWAEPGTGGEAYIPLKGGKRSVDIWQETGRQLGVWKFDQGGFSPDVLAASDLAGTDYSQGNRTDCSGMAARVINRALGYPDTGLMSTKNAAKWLAERGFRPGIGGPGTVTVGWYDHGPNPNDGHMALTLSNGMGAEAGGKNGVFTVGGNAANASNPEFDQHMFLPLNAMYGEGAGGDGGIGGGYSVSGGGTAGVGPGGQPGTYTAPDAKTVREANQKVADADTRVKEAEARQRELEADAKESQKISAQAAVDKAKREADDARADLAETMKGKFTPGKPGKSSGRGSGDFDGLGGIFGSFLKESLGLDGSIFPDISNLGAVQSFGALASAFKGPLQGAIDGQLGIQQPGWQPGMPVNGQAAPSGLPFGFAGQAAPGMVPPGSPASGNGLGPAPGPVDMSRNVSISVDSGPTSGEIANVVRREVASVDRLGTHLPKGA